MDEQLKRLGSEAQLKDNLGAVGWRLTPAADDQARRPNAVTPLCSYWHQRDFAERNPPPA